MIRGLLFVSGLGVVGYGLYRYYSSQLVMLKNSEISLLNVKLVSQTKTNIKLRFNLKVVNKSEEQFTIKDFKIKLLLNGKPLGDVENTDINKVITPNGGASLISFDFSFNPKSIEIEDILEGLISNKLKSDISLEGRMKLKKGIVTVDTPLEISYSLNELF